MLRLGIFALLALTAAGHPFGGPLSELPRLTDRRIVGGTNARDGEFPEQVSIRISGSHACGGTLLSANAVLTAAHCCTFAASRYTVMAGSINVGGSGSNTQTRSVSRVRQHASYNPNTLNNDICILTLSGTISQVAGHIEYATLAAAGREPGDLEPLVVTGWGTTSEGGSLSNTLKKATVPYVPNSRCNTLYGGGILSGMLCAGYEGVGGVDACQGDSGGPIFLADKSQVGITSWGYGCARPQYPGVYTRVPSYRTWITQNMP